MSVWLDMSGIEYSVRFLQVGDWRTRVLEAGRGEPLVLMAGTIGHLEAYARNIAALAGHFRVIA